MKFPPALFSIALVISLAVGHDARGAEWVDLEATQVDTGARYFVDRGSTTLDGDLMYVRVKRELKARYGPPDEHGFSPCIDPMIVCANAGNSIYNFAIHCPSRSTAETAFTHYDEQGQPRSSYSIPRSQWEFSQAAADTLSDRLVSLACQIPRQPIRPTGKSRAMSS